jgi:hypothetical protein
MAITAVVNLSVAVNIANTLNVGASSANLSTNNGLALTSGTAAGMADKTFFDHRTLAASTSETLDLAGVLLDPFGVVTTFARIKVLLISADAANTNNVVIGGGSNALTGLFGATTHTAVIRPGAALAWVTGAADATGYPVTPATGDLLQVANSGAGTSVGYTVIVIGTSV